MRARQRHFNTRDAGADIVLDSRYINQSDNTAVSSWPDRSGNAYNANQATGANRPIFRTAQQGGNGGVDFDGSNDFLTGTYNPTGVPRTCHVTFKADQTASTNTFFQVPQQVVLTGGGWLARWGQYQSNWNISGDATATNQTLASAPSDSTNPIIGSWSSDSSSNVSFFRDGTSLFINGNPPRAVTGGISGYNIGSINYQNATDTQFLNGKIFSIHVWGGEQIASPLRKRCEHASAFSFKIACN